MKTLTTTKNFKTGFPLILLMLSMLIPFAMSSCGSKAKAENPQKNISNQNVISMDIPPLKERTGELSKAEEWTDTKNKIAELNAKIQQNPSDIQSRLKI